jgi:P27 family predicted phage terminase small subunit
MKRGRKKNPENVTPGSQPQPKAVVNAMEPPPHLNAIEAAIFSRVAAAMAGMGVLAEGDLDAIAALAEVKALGILHKKAMDKDGATQTSRTGREVASGDYLIWREMRAVELRILNDLGLTPASRTRVAAVVADEVDEFAEFMARRSATIHEEAETPAAAPPN